MNFDLADGFRMVDEVTKVGFQILASDWLIFLLKTKLRMEECLLVRQKL